MAKKIKVPVGSVLMRHPDANASATWDGVSYQAVDGLVVVPEPAVADLTSFGFIADGTEAEQEPAVEEAVAKPEPVPPEVEPASAEAPAEPTI